MKQLIPLIFVLFLFPYHVFANQYTQTIRGRVVNKETFSPIAFASVLIIKGQHIAGTSTDENGVFRVEKVPVGRATLKVSSVGYETLTIQNLNVTSAHETVLAVEMTESAVTLSQVEVRAVAQKDQPLNMFAIASARTFSVEESQRYAGASNDVSRMAMNFAGVKATNDTQNEIVVRGNSPVGLLFRLDGIDIPNPNHYGDGAVSGGIISMLNNNVLSNSDFMTGAFPAGYGNTISGVFDLQLRNGNNQQHEFLGQASLMGSELAAEGPISLKNGSSYLLNYRYSTVELLNALVDLKMGEMLPQYQDASFKLNFPSRGHGNTSFFGFGGKSIIAMLDSRRDTTQAKPDMTDVLNYETDEYMDNNSGAIGLNHTRLLKGSAYLKAGISATTISNFLQTDSLSTSNRKPTPYFMSTTRRTKYSARFLFNKRINNKNSFRSGVSVELLHAGLHDSIYERNSDHFSSLTGFKGVEYYAQPYINWQHRASDKLKFNIGLHSLWQLSTGNFSLEPRTGLSYELTRGNTLHLAYGLHSMATPVEIMQLNILDENGNYHTSNNSLDYTYSHHWIMGFDKLLTGNWRFKTEIYYQDIKNTVVEKQPSSFSLLNRSSSSMYGHTEYGLLVNGGTGFNYGWEVTVEKFMDKGSYFLSTFSLYESKYRGSDGVLRNSAYNGNYVFNLLGGKEFGLGKNGKYIKKLNIDGKFNLAGGQRFSPIDLEMSRQIGFTQYDESRAWSQQVDPYMTVALRLGIKFLGRSTTQEIAVNISNLTNRKNTFYQKYDRHSDGIKTIYQFGLMPDVLYRISF